MKKKWLFLMIAVFGMSVAAPVFLPLKWTKEQKGPVPVWLPKGALVRPILSSRRLKSFRLKSKKGKQSILG